MTDDVVWLPDEQVFGELLSVHAHYSYVRYVKGGHEYNIIVDHEDYDIIEGEDGDDSSQH